MFNACGWDDYLLGLWLEGRGLKAGWLVRHVGLRELVWVPSWHKPRTVVPLILYFETVLAW